MAADMPENVEIVFLTPRTLSLHWLAALLGFLPWALASFIDDLHRYFTIDHLAVAAFRALINGSKVSMFWARFRCFG